MNGTEPVGKRAEESSLTRSAGFVGISKFVNILGLLSASMVLTRIMSRSEYGNYEQVWLVYNSFLPLMGYGLSSAIYFFSAKEDRRTVYTAAIVWATIVGVATGIVLAVLAPVIAGWFKAEGLSVYIRIFAVYAIASSPSLMFESIFVTEKRVVLLLVANVLLAILFGAAVILSAVIFHNLTIVFVAITAVGVIKSLFLFSFLIRKKRLASGRLSPVMKAQLLYALPIVVSSLTGTLSKQIDRFLVTLFFSPGQFAIYSIGSKEIPMITVITGSAAAVLFPVFSEFGSSEMRDKFVAVWKNSISKTGFFLLPMMVFLLFAARDFMGFFFGEKYVVSAGIFRIFLLLLPLRLAFYSQALFSLGRQKLYMYTSILEMLLSGLASYFLLRAYGMEGAAIGKVVVSYIEVVALAVVLMMILKTNIREFFPWVKIFKIILISICGILPLFFVRGLVENVYLRFVLEGMLFASVFGAVAVLTKSVRIVSLRKLQFVVN
ncbi:MAG: oligosaccharide flippase family protein [Bacteroidetes bacterium]|nr:oligosaccharide flippase family protein [Bacteroidota bacterium]